MDTFYIYLEIGFRHILPLGLDHILFIIGLYLLSPNLKKVIWQATVFTIAHCITLTLAMSGLIRIPASIVEPVIALSILFVAIENIFTEKLKATRIVFIFIFGLVHGLGFAGVLSDLGTAKGDFVVSLLGFNLGVEIGQICVILGAYLLLGTWFSKHPWYHKFIVTPLSLIIAAIALYWTIERIFLV